jgi:hypothetical protein
MTNFFHFTSDLLYDRHDYKIVLSSGKNIVFDNYEDTKQMWYQLPKEEKIYIEVLDKKRKKSTKGFV